MIEVGGFQPFSTTDWPGRLCAVVFVQGCPWRCSYCHNPGLQSRARSNDAVPWARVLEVLDQRRGLLDGVVFSGGEPTLDPALPQAIAAVRSLGFGIGLHTAGIYPARLGALLPSLDWIGLDLKADADQHDRVTGVRGSARAALESLQRVAASSVAYEVRSTGDATLLPEDRLVAMARLLRDCGVQRWVLQRRQAAPDEAEPGRVAWPDLQACARIEATGLAVAVR